MTNLLPTADGSWQEDVPPDCENCSLAWPFDGTIGRVLVGTAVGGRRTFTCEGCGHITYWPPTLGDRPTPDWRIGMAPTGEVPQ